jgi:FlaG/FlaF family flagellin (archaellin)
MKNLYTDSHGISETVSVILVISLVLVLAMVIYAMFFGSILGFLKPTSRVAVAAGTVKVPLDATSSIQIPYAEPISGDKYYLSGQSNIPSGYPVASFVLRDPSGTTHNVKNSSISTTANKFGTPLFIYQDRLHNYWVTDSGLSIASSPAQLMPFSRGVWTVTMIDNTANVPLTEIKVTIGSDSSNTNLQLPNYTTSCGGASGSTGYGINNNSYNIICTTGPNGMPAMHFNGINSYMTLANNPDLTFTGDMTLSLWIKPDTTGSTPANWHTVLGKGQIVGGVENDNYQLVTIGNDLYFEWNDPSGQHYHVSTTGLNPLQNNQWGYVTVVVNGGTTGGVTLYNNGNPVAVKYYPNNNPDPWEGTPMVTPPVVNLKANNLPVNVGIQADPSNPFYYKGDIGNLAVYNRALTAQEIKNNNNNYLA